MKPSAILISVPTRGMIGWATVTRLEAIRDRYQGMSPILYQPGNLSVAQTRNRIVREFLDGPWQALLMVDDDVIPSPHFLDEARGRLGECDVICLPHPMPNPEAVGHLVFGVFDESEIGLVHAQPEFGLNECDAVATGCVLIHRRVLESLGPVAFHIDDDPDAEFTSDDFIFCRDAKQAGYRVGYWWDGWFADHHSTVSLAPLIEARQHA